MILQDFAQDPKVFLAKIIENSCEECIQNSVKSSQYLAGINQVLSNTLTC